MASSSSLDDLFLATNSTSPQRAACTDAFIDALIAPTKETRHRRVSAPNTTPFSPKGVKGQPLGEVFEEEKHERPMPTPPEHGMSVSYSADDMTQLAEDAEKLDLSRWKGAGWVVTLL